MHLPILKTHDDALALAQSADDYFYLAAYKLQVWISELQIEALAQYAEKPNPADRQMQTGQAWRAFQPVFGHVRDQSFDRVIAWPSPLVLKQRNAI